MRIAVIGAGFAGVSAAKVLTQFGHDVTVYEKAPDIGGVWSASRRYPGLRTQNNKGTYCLSDQTMPRHYPQWLESAQVQEYLDGYVDRFGLRDRFRVSTTVISATLSEPDGAPSESDVTANPALRPVTWSVTAEGPEGVSTEEYDYLVSANGIFSAPSIPGWPGREAFEAAGGRLCAPGDVHSLDEVAGRDVLVVGYGKSACDVASAIAPVTGSATVIARKLLWKMPRHLGGAINYKFLMLTRLGEALFEYQRLQGVEAFLHGAGKPVRNSMLASLQAVATRQLKLKEYGLVPDGDFERIARSTVSLVSEGFFEAVQDGSLAVRRDTEIAELLVEDGRPAARLSDGSTVPADVIIAATGWRQDVPFLDADVQARLTDANGDFELYRFILPHEVPGLAFVGYNSSFFSPLSAEMASLYVAHVLDGAAELPPVPERREQVSARLRWMRDRTEGHHARGTNLIPFSMHNIDEIIEEMGLKLSRRQRVREWLLPPKPADYRWVTRRLLARRPRPAASAVPSGAGPRRAA
ncbi:NAD(P)/FAD-dependent oxidoreductase [Tsukamurella sp. M9C]|uniref:flavin-containing monooxygenase n=1 Tax=Tsukamurella sp. M9C TaxID=2877520 RepID=UPI001CC8F5F4|nr:NAD(P)/FAD-dependent oxidoreductase [Tsukamurella sp. M9C]MCA0157458.1 NAD(P)/FAD-dependent oxidoreductase [Tsukamurella sp. M9C]